MHACADDRRGNSGGKVAVADQADARAGGANFGDELFVARAIENDYDEVFEAAIEALGDGAKIVGDWRVKVDRAFARRADDNFFHVEIGSVKQAALFAGGEDGDGIRRAGGAEIRAFERIYGDIHGRIEAIFVAGRDSDFFADVEHRGGVAFALADDDGSVHADVVHFVTHGLHGDVVGFVSITEAHGARGGDGGLLDDSKKFEAECAFHDGSLRGGSLATAIIMKFGENTRRNVLRVMARAEARHLLAWGRRSRCDRRRPWLRWEAGGRRAVCAISRRGWRRLRSCGPIARE